MIISRIGETTALIAAFCLTITGLSFEAAGKKVGSLSVNFISLVFGFLFISTFTYFTRELVLPIDASVHNWTWLSISGVIGFFLGDIFLFRSYVELGTRLTLLIMASSPPLTAILGLVFLNEEIKPLGAIGMLITIIGISVVILSKDKGGERIEFTHSAKGIFFAFLGAVGQAVGTIFSKVGMGDYNAFSATQIRIIAGFLSFFVFFLIFNKWDDLKKAIRNKKAIFLIALGATFGSFLGVSMQLTSLQYTTAGISSTIMAITPVIVIPFSIVIFKEKVVPKEIFGAILSFLGVALLFLV